MEVLKFGGTSVANAQNIKLAIAIINQKAKDKKIAVVVSALSGVTDLLLLASKKAAAKDENYILVSEEIKQKHFETISELIALEHQNQLFVTINSQINQLQTLLNGCYLLGELSPRTSDAIVCFGELLSSQTIAVALLQSIPNSNYKDSRELIKTNSNFGKAVVDFEKTNFLIDAYFSKNKAQVTLLPGFISSSSNGNTTTLGRGGSDYKIGRAHV